MNTKNWAKVDEGLKDLMQGNDQEGDVELKTKSNRLKHLEKFVRTLRHRVNERVREGVKQGNQDGIDGLFAQYIQNRNQIDKN